MTLSPKSAHLLVVDDDNRIRDLLKKYLIENQYLVSTVKNSKEAELLLHEFEFDLIILDVMMPGETGLEFTKKLRESFNIHIPIIMLTAMGEVEDRINGLETGADDYLIKPFEPKELLLRIDKLIKRIGQSNKIIYFGEFSYKQTNQTLCYGYKSLVLTQSERILFDYLLENIGSIVTREALAQRLNINERSIDVQIVRLRNKIENNLSKPHFLQTVRGKGYILRN